MYKVLLLLNQLVYVLAGFCFFENAANISIAFTAVIIFY